MPQDAGIGREFSQLNSNNFGGDKDPKYREIENLNRILRELYNRIDALEGRRGLVQLGSDIDLNGHLVVNSADAVDGGDLVSKDFAEANYGPIAMAEALSLAGTNPLNVSGLRGQLFQAQPAAAPQGDVDVILDTALDGTLFVQNNILYRVDASQSPAVAVPVSGIGVVIAVDHATRVADYLPADYAIGTLLYETDRHYLYTVEDNTGNVWQYTAGIYVSVVADLPGDLGVDDEGALFYATDATEKVLYLWTGAAWETSGVSSGGALTANAIVLGAGGRLITVMGSLGTTTTVLHGNAAGAPTFGAVSLTADVSGVLPIANGGGSSGVYTPTLTNSSNLDGSTAYECQYLRVGNTVFVSGRVDVDPTAAIATVLGISLPIASNIGASEDVGGTAFAVAIAGQGAGIYGDAANDRATMQWIAVDLTNQPMFFSFGYQVI